MAAYGKTELWQAARAVDVEDFDFNQMAPSEAFWPRKARSPEGWKNHYQDAGDTPSKKKQQVCP